ncbi:MAG: FkbM family methyltransferase [Rubrivivax sp.]|nr:MAG: FkbM family methyltransferase [Rubrivivax sp.]
MDATQQPPAPETPYKWALMVHRSGDHAQAEQLCRQLVIDFPDHVLSWCLLGDCLLSLQRAPEAMACYEHARAIKPGHALASSRASSLRFRQAFGAAPTPRPTMPDGDRMQLTTVGAKGRFGNQIFQYAFARIYARRHRLALEVADWVGRDLFELDDALPSRILPRVDEAEVQPDCFTLLESPDDSPLLRNVDLHGYFVPHTSRWAPYRNEFQQMYLPGSRIRPALDSVVSQIRSQGRTLVALHIRRGDFGYGSFWIAPASWYRAQLEKIWPTLDQPVLYIASDDPKAHFEFADFNPVAADTNQCQLPGLEYFVDHYIMSQADRLIIANSSFSYTAAMINDTAQGFYRPDPAQQGMREFDPWNDAVTLSAEQGREPVAPIEAQFIRQLIQPADNVMHVGGFCSPWTTAVRETHPFLRVFELESGESLDEARQRFGARHVNHLALEDLDALPHFMAQASQTLSLARLDFIHFRAKLGEQHLQALKALQAWGFHLYGLTEAGVYPLPPESITQPISMLAIQERLVPLLFKRPGNDMIDLHAQCQQHGIQVRGVIHVGAHEGKEIGLYENTLNAQRVLYVEANPAVFARLTSNINERADKKSAVILVNRAVSDTNGTLQLHLATFDQSSSILPMELHREVYPQVEPAGSIDVQASRLDDLMADFALNPTGFNLLNIDVQGAEALVLRGAPEVLKHVEAVNVEVNFADLYRGGALIEDIEAILLAAGFKRVALCCPYHPTWGDALYIRKAAAAH